MSFILFKQYFTYLIQLVGKATFHFLKVLHLIFIYFIIIIIIYLF